MRKLLFTLLLTAASLGAAAQNSLPAPGTGGSFSPQPPATPYYGGGCMGSWGDPWCGTAPMYPVENPVYASQWQDNGLANVVAVGYDSTGVWRTVPLKVQYDYNGVQYNVTVIDAWNPWTDVWNDGVDVQAFNTSYVLNNRTYDFYVVLSTGTFYFNL